MMLSRTLSLSLLFLVLLTPSCTIEKRLYQKGWHVERNKHVVGVESTLTENSLKPVGIREEAQQVPVVIVEEANAVSHAVSENAEVISPGKQADFTSGASMNEPVSLQQAELETGDSLTVSREEPQVSKKELRDYNIVTYCLLAIMFGLLALCAFAAMNAVGIIEGLGFVLLFIVLLLALLIVASARYSGRPDRKAKRKRKHEEREAYRKRAEEGRLTEDELEKEAKMKKRKTIVFSVFFAFIGLMIYLSLTW